MRALRVAALVPLVVAALASSAAATTFRVDSSAEDLDANPGDGVCATLGGDCTIRAALEEADILKRPVDIVRPAVADPSTLVSMRSTKPRALPPAPITTFTVDTTVDAVDALPGDGVCATVDGTCSLRAAVMEANDLEGPQAITLPAGQYTLIGANPDENESTVGDLDVLDELAITGAGSDVTTIDGDDVGKVLDSYHTLTLTGLTITGGSPTGLCGWFVVSTITDCEIVDNDTGIDQRSYDLTLTRGRLAANRLEGAHLNWTRLVIDGTTIENNAQAIRFDFGNRGTVKNMVFRGNGFVDSDRPATVGAAGSSVASIA